MRIALAQITCTPDTARNIAQIAALTRRAQGEGCSAVLFPELSDTGYDLAGMGTRALDWSGAQFATIVDTARSCGIHVIAGLSERAGMKCYDSIAVLSPRGELVASYRKRRLMSVAGHGETDVFSPGKSATTAEIGGMVWGFSVCYDLRFPELYGELAARGAEVLVNCAAWPVARIEHWKMLSRARAVENQAYFLGVNHNGSGAGSAFGGASCVIEPRGDVVAQAGSNGDGLTIADIDKEKVQEFRASLPVLRERLEVRPA